MIRDERNRDIRLHLEYCRQARAIAPVLCICIMPPFQPTEMRYVFQTLHRPRDRCEAKAFTPHLHPFVLATHNHQSTIKEASLRARDMAYSFNQSHGVNSSGLSQQKPSVILRLRNQVDKQSVRQTKPRAVCRYSREVTPWGLLRVECCNESLIRKAAFDRTMGRGR